MSEIILEDILPLIEKSIAEGAEFCIYPGGKSMLPLIHGNRDAVYLVSPDNLKKGDVVLYRRSNGKFVLHRIVKTRKKSYDMCGDNQSVPEKGIVRDMITAKVGAYLINGNRISTDDRKLAAYVRYRLFSRPFRRFFDSLSFRLHRIFKK